MQRKPGFPGSNCNIKMPDSVIATDSTACEEDGDQQQRRQQLINFGHTQWGFNNWSWSVTKQDLDFVDFASGKYSAGVVAFVSVQVKNIDIHRENIGYATSAAAFKGSAIHQARKSAVTNALRETLLSFGGDVATDLQELLEATRNESPGQAAPDAPATHDNNQHLPSRPAEPKRAAVPNKGDPPDATVHVIRPLHAIPPAARSAAPAQPSPALPVAAAHPMRVDAVRAPPPPAAAAPRPPAPPPVPAAAPPAPAPPLRPNSNVSFVLQPVMPGLVPPLYAAAPPPACPAPRLPPAHPHPHPHAHMFPNAYYEYGAGPWHFAYEPHGNVNLNFNIPPKSLVVNSRGGSVECGGRTAPGAPPGPAAGPAHAPGAHEPEPPPYGPPPSRGCWIKPTIFYDGFWTEQKVKKWVAEQVEKQYPEDGSNKSTPSTGQHDAASHKS